MPPTTKEKVTIRGKTYDLADAVDLTTIQSALVPDNWPGKKADCVRLFLATKGMLSLQFLRHLAANWKDICKATTEQALEEEGGKATLAIAFNFEVDQTSPMVAAITKVKMGFSVKHSTVGKPQTFDINQGEIFDESGDMTQVFDTKSLAAEAEEAKGEQDAPSDDAPAGDGTNVVNLDGSKPESVDKTKRKAKKKGSKE